MMKPPGTYPGQADEQAFEAFVRRESPRLFLVLARLLGDEGEAGSVMQDVFAQAFAVFGAGQQESRRTTRLYAMGIERASAALRLSQRDQVLSEEDVERLQPTFRNGKHVFPFRLGASDQEGQRSRPLHLIRQTIDQLPCTYRTVVILRDVAGFSTGETARILDLDDATVRRRLHQARQALKALLETPCVRAA